ncbi:hypothetical protein ASPZODRAFT_140378 [Penicilliopsis zonata CBS 506.65]|uniref:Uncharacterized protein n=1 Tax=Penicilliopsis zonata CBS 506.65 TaxID=1073090 RepID=A0A1L9SQX9_9EURO|nr:hypothetical protein ASPZODRAFT_140378 [Penicilliopsis zonata CBS 506.65]OJJ49481.1 hypothetical protein ASPZODRAFT_140378 [Penicilliopsis zonata CBS 506.65]
MRQKRFLLALLVFAFLAACLWLGGERALPLAARLPELPYALNGLWRDETAQLHEVADLMLKIYETLARMRYIDPSAIERGPHNVTELLPLYETLGLDSSVIYLYSILPYINPIVAGRRDFFHGGQFADFRDPEQVEQGRDPFYANPEDNDGDFDAENGPYMRPWMTPLSQLGNHESVILYDARKHRVWIIDQESWASTDLALEGVEDGKPRSHNENSFEHIPSRPAGAVLRDINNWYLSLQEVPGGGEQSDASWGNWPLNLTALYRAHGWPDDFDGDAFGVSQARAYAAWNAKIDSEEPLRKVESLARWEKALDDQRVKQLGASATANTPDEKWAANFELWKIDRKMALNQRALEEARQEVDRRCPGGACQKKEDLPLWELKALRPELQSKQSELAYLQDSDDGPDLFKPGLRQAEMEAIAYQKALEAATADAERLCPGRSLQLAPGSGRQQVDRIVSLQGELDAFREWAVQLPSEAQKTREMVDSDIHQFEESLRFEQSRRQKESNTAA